MQELPNSQSAVLRVAQMAEADHLTVAAGTPVITLMENVGGAPAREIERRWTVPHALVLCAPGNPVGFAPRPNTRQLCPAPRAH